MKKFFFKSLAIGLLALIPAISWAQTAVPYTETFESYSSGLPTGWSHLGNGSGAVANTSSYQGSKSLKFSGATTNNIVALPKFTSDIKDLQLVFWTKPEQNSTNCGTFDVGYLTNPTNQFTFVAVETYNYSDNNGAYTQHDVVMSAAPTGAVFAFCHNSGSSNWYWFVDNVEVTVAPSCKKTAKITISSITSSSATINWTAVEGASAYDVTVGTQVFSGVIGTSQVVTGLSANTLYDVSIVTDCGGGDKSSTKTTSFRTECNDLEFNTTYGFESDVANQAPMCWTVGREGNSVNLPVVTANGSTSTTKYAHEGTNSLKLNYYYYKSSYSGTTTIQKAWAALPKVADDVDVSSLTVSAFAYASNTNYGALKVGVMTNPNDFSTFVPCSDNSDNRIPCLDDKTQAVSSVKLENYTGTGKYIAFVIDNGNNSFTAYLDNITVTKGLSKPKNIQVSAGKNSADVTFDQEDATGLTWEYQLNGGTAVSISSQSFTINSLTGSTNYNLKIRAVKSGEYSAWAETNFSTECDDYAISATNPFIENFAGKQLPACWSEFTESAFAGNYGSGNIYFNAIRAYFLPKMDFTNLSASACMFSFDASNSLSNVKILAAASLDGVTPQNIEDYVIATVTVDQVRRYDVYLSDYASQLSGKSYIGFVNTATALTIDSVVLKKAPAVRKPKDVTIGNIKYNQASIVSLTQEDQVVGGTWGYEIDKVNTFDSEALDMGEFTEMPAVIEALDETSTYYVRVKYIVNSEESEFSDVISFTTSAAPIAIPYSDGFESYSGSYYNDISGTVPTKWISYSTAGSVRPHVISEGNYKYVHAGDKALTFYGSGYCYAAMPKFDVEINKLEVSFWMQQESASNGELVLGYITAADVNMNTFVQLTAFGKTGTMTQRNVRMDDFEIPANAVRLVFRWYYSGQYSCCIDDVLVKKAKCKAPTPEVSSITTSSAVLSIQEDVAWAYKTTEEGTPVAVAASETVSLTDLEANTEYIVYVQSACSADDKSDFVADTFRTACEAQVALGYTEDFADGIPTCMKAIGAKYNQYGTKYVTMSDKAALILPTFEATTDWSTLQLSFNGSTNNTTSPVLKVIAYDETVENLADQVVLASVNLAISMSGVDVYLNEIADINTKMAGKRLGLYRAEAVGVSIDDIVIKTASQFKAPTNLAMTAESETAEGADFTFEQPGVATNVWVVEVATENSFAENKIAKRDTITATSFTLISLNMKTKYFVRVKQMDGEVSSNFSNVVEFTTECGQLALNTVYDMESYTAGTSYSVSYQPSCWGFKGYYSSYEPYVYNSTTYNHTTGGSKSMRLQGYSSSNPSLFTLPVAGEDVDMNMVTVTFWAVSSSSYGVDLKVGVQNSANTYSSSAFKVAETINVTNAMTKYTVRLDGLTGLTDADKYITFANAASSTSYYVYVDDIEVKMSACAMASGAAASEITDVTAKLSITNATPNWNVVVKEGETAVFSQSNITTAEVVATGLSAQTNYVASITMNCPQGGESDPVEVKFTTACATLTDADVVNDTLVFEDFESNAFDECWPMISSNKPLFNSTKTQAHSGTKLLNIYGASASNPKIIVMPSMNINWADYQLSFWSKMWTATAGEMKIALAETAPTTAAEATALPVAFTATVDNAEYKKFVFDLKNADTEGKHFVVLYMNGTGDISFDDLAISKPHWETIRTGLHVGEMYTTCQAKNMVAMDGGVLYEPEDWDGTYVTFVEAQEMKAGYGYLLVPEKADVKVLFGDSVVTAAVADAPNGMQGTLVAIDGTNGYLPTGDNYCGVNAENHLQYFGANNKMAANRAYIVIDKIGAEPTNAPVSARRIKIGGGKGISTGMDNVAFGEKMESMKVIMNGQLLIIRNGKVFNAQGQVVK